MSYQSIKQGKTNFELQEAASRISRAIYPLWLPGKHHMRH